MSNKPITSKLIPATSIRFWMEIGGFFITNLREGTTLARSSDLAGVFALVDLLDGFDLLEALVDFLALVVVRNLEGLDFAFPAIESPSVNMGGL